ncbi:MAG: ferritin family protein [Candidatus Woesearchaeota archaeon]
MTVRTWRCNICGDSYIGEGKPTHCPFCGATAIHMLLAKDYKEPKVGKLTDASRDDVFEAIKLEVDNAQFYFCASRNAKDIELQARFKALGKVEAEHAAALAKIVGAQNPIIDHDITGCPKDDAALVQESHDREQRAIEKYTKFLAEATDLRVKEVFSALIEVERTHLDLADKK